MVLYKERKAGRVLVMKNTVAVILALLLAACAASGQIEHPASFQMGKTKLPEVAQALGEANSSTVSDAGGRTACYQYAGVPTVPESFIRIVGSPSQEADLTCCFSFTNDGVLGETDLKLQQVSDELALAAKSDAQADRKATCPPPPLKPEAVVHLAFARGQ